MTAEKPMEAEQSRELKFTACATVAGAVIAFMWMYLAAIAISSGVSFPTWWNWAAYISCPAIKLFGLNFWPVVLGNGLSYATCVWILWRLFRRKTTAETASSD
jgi:cytochrome c biogenesis protein CcdA